MTTVTVDVQFTNYGTAKVVESMEIPCEGCPMCLSGVKHHTQIEYKEEPMQVKHLLFPEYAGQQPLLKEPRPPKVCDMHEYELSLPLGTHLIKNIILSHGLIPLTMIRATGNRETDSFLNLFRRYGNHCIPQKSEGLLKLQWESYFRGTVLEDALLRAPAFQAAVFELPQVNVYMEVHGPTVIGVRCWEGVNSTGETYVENGVQYHVCSKKLSESVVDTPLAIRSNFFNAQIQKDAINLVDPLSYAFKASSYAGQYFRRHVEQAKVLLENYFGPVIEPGCGAGVVRHFRENVTSGDLYPPQWADKAIKQEDICQTILRGPRDALIYMGYLRQFVNADVKRLLEGRRVMWVDSPDVQGDGVQVGPGVFVTGPYPSEMWPTTVPLEKRQMAKMFNYSENLLSGQSYCILSESRYSTYLRIMRPWIPFHYLPEYTGSFFSNIPRSNQPILCAELLDLVKAMEVYPTAQYYFCPIGKVITMPTDTNYYLTDSGTQLTYEYRRVYKVRTNTVMGKFLQTLPFINYGDCTIGYDQEHGVKTKEMTYGSPTAIKKMKITRVEDVNDTTPTFRGNGGHRIYVMTAGKEASYQMEGHPSQVHAILKNHYLHGIDDDTLEKLFGEVWACHSRSRDPPNINRLVAYRKLVESQRLTIPGWLMFLDASSEKLRWMLGY
jgi:hypothetical protein